MTTAHEPPSDASTLVREAKARAGSYRKLGKALGYDRAGVERLRRAASGETQRPGSDLVDDVRAYLSGRESPPDAPRSSGLHDIPGDSTAGTAEPTEPEDMEVPREHARETAFHPSGDHPRLSTIAVHPDYVVYGMDGLVRFRVSYVVEAAPPIQRRSGPEGGKA